MCHCTALSSPFFLSFEPHLLWAHRLDWLWGHFDQEWVIFFSNIYPCLCCVNRLYINHFICNLLFAYLLIDCAAYRHQQAYGSIYVAYHQQRDHAHSAQTGLHGVDQSIYFLTNEVNLHRFSRHTCPSLTSQQCAAAQWLKNNGLVWGGGLV